jgi:hypothetical protein
VSNPRRLVKVRGNSVLVILDERGRPYIEVRPTYNEGIGPAITLYRVNLAGHEYMCTLRLPTVTAFIRKLPIVTAAALRLEAKAQKPAK